MENEDITKINEIITKSQSNVEHLEGIMEMKKYYHDKPTEEYILCQIEYFNLIIFYNKRLLEIQEKLSLEYFAFTSRVKTIICIVRLPSVPKKYSLI